MIEYPLHDQLGQQIYLGPNLNRSCVNFTAIDDNIPEPDEPIISEEVAYIFLVGGEKSNAKVIDKQLEIYILDDDREYSSRLSKSKRSQ